MTEPEPEDDDGAVVPLSPLELDEPDELELELDFELLELELPDELEPEEPEPAELEPDEPEEDAVVWAAAGRVAATPAVVRMLANPAAAVIRRSRARLRSRSLIAAPVVRLAEAAGSCVIAHLPGRLMSLSLPGLVLQSL